MRLAEVLVFMFYPTDEQNDTECMHVLYRVQMLTEGPYRSQRSSLAPSGASAPAEATFATRMGGKTKITLDIPTICGGGTDVSQGQRQLIAMAYRLFRRSSIIVFDVATSSIDFETDAKIQLGMSFGTHRC